MDAGSTIELNRKVDELAPGLAVLGCLMSLEEAVSKEIVEPMGALADWAWSLFN